MQGSLGMIGKMRLNKLERILLFLKVIKYLVGEMSQWGQHLEIIVKISFF